MVRRGTAASRVAACLGISFFEGDLTMCGICGVVAGRGGPTITDNLVTQMRDTMVHRGPDGAGLFTDEGVGLGHRRLSIVDVAHGHQPMASEDGRYVLVYNGEVFNHPTL